MRKILLSLCLMPVLAFAQAVLPTTWNFSSPGVSTPPIGWAYNVGTNGNLTYAFGKDDALSARLDATGENIVITFAEKPGLLTYFISPQNAGRAWSGQFDIQESPDGTNWTTIRSYTSTTTSATNFSSPMVTDSLKATTRAVRFFYTNKLPGTTTGGGNMALDNITVTKAAASSVGINVKSGTSTVLNGSTFVYGNPAFRLLTLENSGTSADLKVDSMVISGLNASDFSIGSFDSITPANNGADTFRLLFNPGAPGSRFATLKIYSNDVEKSPYSINLYGIGGSYATEPTQVSSITVSNVRTQTMLVNFGKISTEGYIVLRKTGNSITEVPVDGVTYKKGDYIGGAQVAYIGTDTATIRPLYILANTSYAFAAFSFNGPSGYENYNTTNAPSSTVTTLNGEPGTYYNGIDPANANFVTQLHNKVTVHDTVFYSNYIAAMINNYLVRDTTGGKKVVNCVYTGAPYVYDEPFTWWTGQSGNPGTLTREHSFAQSWMPTNTGGTWPNGANGREYQEYNDLHHLFPADQVTANGKRSNNPFGVVYTPTYTSPTGQGKLGADSLGKTVYEPRDEHKGDLARALFYMLISYNGVSNVQWRLPASQDIAVLLKWHQQDPPSALEIARNEHIYTYQRNRNPFIDHPEWVSRINFSNMTYNPIPGNGTVTVSAPLAGSNAVQGKKATISWSASGMDSVLVELQTQNGGAFTALGVYPATLGSISPDVTWPLTNAAVVRVSNKSDASVNALSGVFNVVKSAIDVTSPATDAQLMVDSSYTLTWTSAFVDSVIVNIEFKDSNNAIVVIPVSNGPIVNNNSYTFTVPANAPAMGGLYVRQAGAIMPMYRSYDSVSVQFKKYVGLTENTSINHLVSMYPVPSSEVVNVFVPTYFKVNAIEVYDITGRLVNETTQTQLHFAQKGMYIIRVITNGGVATKRVIIE